MEKGGTVNGMSIADLRAMRSIFRQSLVLLTTLSFLPFGVAGDLSSVVLPSGIDKRALFETSRTVENPIEIRVVVDDWKRVHNEKNRELAKSKARFVIDGVSFEGAIEARGNSRFVYFSYRGMRFVINGENFEMVTRFGSMRGKKIDSNGLQDARVLSEYSSYKIYELLYPQQSEKTRLARIQFVDREGAKIDAGFGFFVEGHKEFAERLGLDRAGSFVDYDSSVDDIRGDIYRKLILDTDVSNMPNNYVYLSKPGEARASVRVPYDFDLSLLAPPRSLKKADIRKWRTWFGRALEMIYQIGPDGMQLTKVQDGAVKEQLLSKTRETTLNEVRHLLRHRDQILKIASDQRVPEPYRSIQAEWYKQALEASANFLQAHSQ